MYAGKDFNTVGYLHTKNYRGTSVEFFSKTLENFKNNKIHNILFKNMYFIVFVIFRRFGKNITEVLFFLKIRILLFLKFFDVLKKISLKCLGYFSYEFFMSKCPIG